MAAMAMALMIQWYVETRMDGGAPAGGKPPLNKINFCVIPAGPRRPPTKKNIPTTTMGCLYVELAFTPLQTPSFANSCRVGDWAVH